MTVRILLIEEKRWGITPSTVENYIWKYKKMSHI